jgi:hypothetical protein
MSVMSLARRDTFEKSGGCIYSLCMYVVKKRNTPGARDMTDMTIVILPMARGHPIVGCNGHVHALFRVHARGVRNGNLAGAIKPHITDYVQ